METVIFFAFVAIATYVDLFVLNQDHHEISLREAGRMSAAWTGLSLLFSGYVFVRYGQELWMQFLAGYALEEALSIDNLFVIAVVFKAFGIQGSQQKLALSWGIIGAVAMRALLIFVGVGLVHRFHWLLPIFGLFLIYTGVKMFGDDEGEAKDLKDSFVYRLASKVMPVYPGFDGDKIVTVQNGRRMLTMLGMAIVMVEGTDLIFALDSIPAVMGVSTDPFIVLTSNIFAVLGLRALYFLLAGILGKFRYLKVGLAVVLIFIGVKMVGGLFGLHVPTGVSLLVVLGTIAVSIVASLVIPEREKVRE